MSSGIPINSARRTKTYAAADLDDVDGIKTDFTGDTADHTYLPADFNGAQILTGGFLDLPRVVTITRTSVANAYSVNPIVITGKRGSDLITDSITPANDDGGDTLRGTKSFDSIISILIPANALNTGHYTIGVSDICAPDGSTFTGVKLDTAGQINPQYGEKANANTDSYALDARVLEPIAPTRFRTSASLAVPTTVKLTVYLG